MVARIRSSRYCRRRRSTGIKGKNPIASGELTIENIRECEKNNKNLLF